MDKTKKGWNQGTEVWMAGVGRIGGGESRQLYLNNNKILKMKKNKNKKRIVCQSRENQSFLIQMTSSINQRCPETLVRANHVHVTIVTFVAFFKYQSDLTKSR